MELVAALTLALAGSLHCFGMCGPIALTVGKSYGYVFGRILSYSILGAIAGLGGDLLALGRYEQTISIVCGIAMMVFALLQITIHWNPFPTQLFHSATRPIRTALQRLLTTRSSAALFGIGVLNGFLPCGLVFSALFGAVSTSSAVRGALFMAVFGLGTVPVMASLAFGFSWLTTRFKTQYKLVMPVAALVVSGLVIMRGMGLGIPYLSPKPPSTITEKGCCGTVLGSHSHSTHVK